MNLSDELREFVESFLSNKVDFVVVGAYALAYHRLPRFTGDIDLFVSNSIENGQRICRALADFGFASLGLKPSDFTASDQVIQLGYPPNRIDILTGISEVSFEEAIKTAEIGPLESLQVPFISKELLIKNKKAVGRPKDISDLSKLTENS